MSDPCTVKSDCIDWPIPQDGLVCAPCVDLDDPVDGAAFEAAWHVAASIMYNKTGQQWPGECFVERVRPCVDPCLCPPRDCKCGVYNYLDLSNVFCLPIQDVLCVNIAPNACYPQGTQWGVLDKIRLEWHGSIPKLVIQDWDGCCEWWPRQDLCKPDGAPCTWSIDARTGCAPPPEVLAATVNLANEIVLECKQTGCTAPKGATSVTTRGASFTKDKDSGGGFWYDIMRQCIKDQENKVVEQFGACQTGVSFHKVFGPTPGCCPPKPCVKSVCVGCEACDPVKQFDTYMKAFHA